MKYSSIRELINKRADANGSAIFLLNTSGEEPVTFAEMRVHAAAIAHYLADQGVKPGDSVAYAMSNGPECALCLLGILYGGYRCTAINLIAGKSTIAYVLDHSDTRLVLTHEEHLPLLADAHQMNGAAAQPQFVNTDQQWWSSLGAGKTISHKLDPDADGLLMYTSGTTGRPKGVVLTQSNLLAAGRNPTISHAIQTGDRALCVLPLYHINGFCTTIMTPLFSGSSVLLPNKYSTTQFWQWIREYQCTWFSVVPTHISYLLHAAADGEHNPQGLEQVRFGRSASAPLAPDIQQAFEHLLGIPIVETMGLTETAGQITSNPLPPGLRKTGSPGIAVGGEVIIADEQQQEIRRGHEGEILVRGDNVMNRYLNNAQATQAALTSNGWLRTGDIGRMDEDGYIFVTGRLKELIIKGGENIAPREIDEALYSHPKVIEAAAFACPCQRYGQRVEAAVTLTPGSTTEEKELLSLCADLLGSFKCPDKVHILAELPKGPSGKIQRLKLAETLLERPIASGKKVAPRDGLEPPTQ